ncbi:MAG: patatin-like protein [Acidobacteriota bacterium]
MSNSPSQSAEYTKEVRFAVVMYGGVSLAIYINGVAQELFRMVRSTAKTAMGGSGNRVLLSADPAAEPENGLKGTERVYRKVSYLIADKELLDECRKLAKEPKQNGSVSKKLPERLERALFEKDRPVQIRFLVDILSGTSAGGINAIYLAKAFANQQQIDQLKDLWVNEGDIALLLNDKRSVMGLHLRNQEPPQSLLNSRRMYFKLLKSLEDMEKQRPSTQGFDSPYVDELDLFITATDIEGVPVPLRLSDAVVFERRHRNVFHFKYAKKEVVGRDFNDFTARLNPFLAFAARCTSSFPFAFEPMRLSDIDEVLKLFGNHRNNDDSKSDSQGFQRYFQEELDPNTGSPIRPPRFSQRSFGDGGYLDNKPFSYATETLAHRQSDVPVDRKLIYIEPSPEHPEDNPSTLEKPNALQNVKAALVDLPTYETIREDLQRVLDRNQLIERVNRIISGIERDVNNYIPEAVERHLKRKPSAGHADEEQSTESTKALGTGSGGPPRASPFTSTESHEVDPVDQERSPWEDQTDDEKPGDSTSALGTGSSDQTRASLITGTGSMQDGQANPERSPHDPPSWAFLDLADMVKANSRYFLPYRRLRISAVTDEIARLFARLANFDEESDQFLAIRALVRLWREENYRDYRKEGWETVNRFLWSYDYGYRQRRLSFARAKVDQVSQFEDGLTEELKKFSESLKTLRAKRGDSDLSEKVLDRFPQIRLQRYGERLLPYKERQNLLQPVLRFIKSELNEIFKNLRTTGRWLRSRERQASKEPLLSDEKGMTSVEASPNPLLEYVKNIGLTPQDLTYILGMTPEDTGSDGKVRPTTLESDLTEDDHVARAKALLARKDKAHIGTNLKTTAGKLKEQLEVAFFVTRNQTNALFAPHAAYTPISETGQKLLAENPDLLKSDVAEIARGFLSYYYNQFDDYDQIRFPIMYETDYGEADVVEVIRISPEDAVSLINERRELLNSPRPGKARQKLAGVSLHHFGAFLDRTWRQNDIMWGRLDGAERLIAGLLPGKLDEPIRQVLIKEAHLAILKEELKPESLRGLQGVLTEALMRASGGLSINEAIKETLGPLEKSPIKTRLEEIMRLSMADEELLTFMSKGYEVNRQLDPKVMLTSISRSSQIIGKMFENLADANGLEGKRLAWIARLGQIFWGLVEVAVPNGILNLLVFHWLKLLYLFEVLLIVGSIILGSPATQNFGWKALALTAGVNVAVLLLRDYMRLRHTWQHILLSILALATLVLAIVGAYDLYSIGINGILYEIVHFAKKSWEYIGSL